ncbi:MAG: glycosyltransferase, partial [Myxococcales bacterium]|nr:glycosyltransferase [Myxococcales bacterium]
RLQHLAEAPHRLGPGLAVGRAHPFALDLGNRPLQRRALAGEVEALGVSAARVAVVPTGVDVRRFYPVDREAARRDLGLGEGPLIAVPSRLAPEKGIRHFIDALATLPGVRAVLVGDGPEEPALRAQVARLGLAERVAFAGFQPEPEMKRYYSAADLVCLPSLEEGWPNAVMESFAGGCPVVASDVGGVPDQIALTGSGLTAPPGDAPGLAERLREALARDWDREATARAMESHTLAHTARRYVEICAEAAG